MLNLKRERTVGLGLQQHDFDRRAVFGVTDMRTPVLRNLTADRFVREADNKNVEYLEAALDEIRQDYGSLQRYVQDIGGLDAERRQRLQALLLE